MSSSTTSPSPAGRNDPPRAVQQVLLVVGWVLVGVPLVYGLVQTLRRVSSLFTG